MALRVPRRPETNAPTRQQGYAQAVQPLDIRPITQVIDRFREELQEKELEDQKFQLNRRFMQEVNELQADFSTRQRDPTIGLDTFTETTNQAYEERHRALVDEFYEQGYDDDLLDEFDTRLGTVRGGFFERSLGHQIQGLTARASEELDQYGIAASQLAASNPDAWTSVEEDIRETVSLNPYLTEAQKLAKTDELLNIARQGGGRAYAIQHAEDVIRLFDPQGFTAPVSSVQSTTGAYGTLTGWQGVATTVAETLGLDATEVAAVMSFESAGTFDPTKMGGAGGNYMGLIQFGPEERRTYGIDENSTPEDWTQAILGFMGDRGFERGMGLEDFYSTILTGSPGNYDGQDANGTNVRNAIPRILSEHRGNAERWLSSGTPTIDPGASTAEQAPVVGALTEVHPANSIAEVQTGVPILDALNGPERLQVLGWAREQQNKITSQTRAAADVAIGNAVAAIPTGGYAGPLLTEEQVLRIYGPIEGPQKWAEFNTAIQAGQIVPNLATLTPVEIQRQVELLKPDPASETYAQELEIYNGAQRAAAEVVTARQRDPAAYVIQAFPEVRQAIEGADSPEDRRAAYAQMARAMERIGIPEGDRVAMSKEMLDDFAQQYSTLPAEGKLQALEQALNEMGDLAGRTLGAAPGSQLTEDIAIYAMLRRNPGYAQTFAEVMRGKAIIREDPARRPSQDYLNTQFASGISTAINNINPTVSRGLNEAAAAIYVQRGGMTGKGADGTERFDRDLYLTSLRVALGGSGAANTGIVNMSPSRTVTDWTVLPTGVTKTQFENWIDQLEPGDLTRLSVGGRGPVDRSMRPIPLNSIIDEGVFVMVSPGKYGIKLASDGNWLMDSTGERFVVHLNLRPVR